MSKVEELKEKEGRVREFLNKQKLDALLLSRQDSFAWATCGGDNHVSLGRAEGVASVLFTKDRRYVLTTNIEARRIMDEELDDEGWEIMSYNWFEANKMIRILKELVAGGKLASDTAILGIKFMATQLAKLRYPLTEQEVERYRWLGQKSAQSLGDICREIKRGESELEIAAKVSNKLLPLGIIPTVLLVAVDNRISKYRHPIPTENKLKKYAMLVLCARKWGLVTSLTRSVYFGEIPSEIKEKQKAVAYVDATCILNTNVGVTISDIFNEVIKAYSEIGYPEEWKLHHQGGATGYKGRDYLATSRCKERVLLNQAFAWNPSISGVKSEDTVVVRRDKKEIVTEASDWPMLLTEYKGSKIKRPDILSRKEVY